MDAERFERILRTMSTSPSRRQALSGLLGALLGGALSSGSILSAAKKKGKGGKGKKGKGKGKKGGKGKTKKPQCPASCPVCQQCVDGQSCTPIAGNTPCDGAGRCLNGVCNQPPNCVSFALPCGQLPTDTPCCAGTCSNLVNQCLTRGDAGAKCNVNADCTSQSCVGYRCQ
jgi:hypothetical protein